MTIVVGLGAGEVAWTDGRDKVRRDLWRPSVSAVPDDQVDRALHSSILELEAERRWLWLEGIQTSVTLSEAADRLILAGSVKTITSLAYLSGISGYDLLDQDPMQRVRQLARGSRGAPSLYAIGDRIAYFDATVQAGAQFEIIFTSGCAEYLSDAIAAPSITLSRQTPAVIANAAHYVSLTYLKNEQEAVRQRAVYERILERLFLEEDTKRADGNGGGQILPDDNLQTLAFGGGYG